VTWTLRSLSEGDLELWDRVALESPSATVFHHPAWSDLLSRVFGGESTPFVVERDGERVGVWPVFLTRMGGMRVASSFLRGWATPYGGPVLLAGSQGSLPDLVRELRRELRPHYFETTLLDSSDAQDAGLLDYSVEQRRTLVLKLGANPQILWKGLTAKCRNMVRKAQRSGVEVEEVPHGDFLDTYWEMAVETWHKTGGRPGIPLRFYRLTLETLHPLGLARILVARREGKPLAAAILLRNGGRQYYWDGVSYAAARQFAPNNLIQWTAIEQACLDGGNLYDFLGANDPGIARFKKSFGGESKEYIYLYSAYGVRARVGRFLYKNLYRPLRRRLA
jgi:CelD/BcsL family acetyltransferase involved in cellulose biosynthesis